jgi:hypothetical protein
VEEARATGKVAVRVATGSLVAVGGMGVDVVVGSDVGVGEMRVGVAVGSGIVPLHPASRGRANRKPNISGSDLLSLILF